MKNCTSPALIPYLTVRNARDAIRFYQDAFDFIFENPKEVDQAGAIEHVEMRYRDLLIMFSPEGAFGGTTKAPATLGIECPLTLYLYCDSVDTIYQKAMQAGARSSMEPQDAFWGDRVCKLTDPDGFEWMFASRLEQ